MRGSLTELSRHWNHIHLPPIWIILSILFICVWISIILNLKWCPWTIIEDEKSNKFRALSQLTTCRRGKWPLKAISPTHPQKWPYFNKRCAIWWKKRKFYFFIFWVMVKILRIVWKMTKFLFVSEDLQCSGTDLYILATDFSQLRICRTSPSSQKWCKFHERCPQC